MLKLPLLELKKISKSYGSTLANHNIDLKIKKKEIRALLGENGAGKSTLVKIIYGVTRLDEGKIYWEGKLLKKTTPEIMKNLGVQMVFQHFSLLESFTIAENISLSLKKIPKNLNQKIIETSQKYGLNLDPTKRVYNLSVSEKQRVEIVRALLQNPQLLILDEPTSVLNPIEIETLFHFLKQLAKEGCGILYISHKLEEIKALCDSVTILNKGKVTFQCNPKKETVESLAEKMIGRNLLSVKKLHFNLKKKKVIFQVKDLSISSQAENIGLKDINFSIHEKEILAIAGVAGNGQKILQDALFGLTSNKPKNSIFFLDKDLGKCSIYKRRKEKIAFVPAERLGTSVVPEIDLIRNNFLTSVMHFDDYILWGNINEKKIAKDTEKIIADYNVVASSKNAEAKTLSGGNLQKFILGRELLSVPKLLIVVNPTWGVDAGAKKFIHQILLQLVENGGSILLISQDLDEIYEIADNVAVLFEGKLSPTYPISQVNNKKMGLLMGGKRF